MTSQTIPLEKQLQILSSCGIILTENATSEQLLAHWSEEEFQANPFMLLLVALGSNDTSFSRNIWHLDTECIEDHGDYITVAKRIQEITMGALAIDNITDFVDIEEEEAWLEFSLNGERYHWDCNVEDDWLDTDIISNFVELVDSQPGNSKLVYISTGGQDCIILFLTPEQMEKLKNDTGLDAERLT